MMMEPIQRPPRTRGWPRLLSVVEAADYLGISASSVREHGPKPKRFGKRVLYDIQDLDRWADRLDDQPLEAEDEAREAAEVERQWLERRRGRS